MMRDDSLKRIGLAILLTMACSLTCRAENPVIINNNNNVGSTSGGGAGESAAPGMVIFSDVWAGGLAGGILGFSGGLYAYGADQNTNPRQITLATLYGFLGGSALGLGMGFMEYNGALAYGTGKNLGTYVATGSTMGAIFGLVIACIPYVTEEPMKENFYYGTMGIGLGGLIGGGLGVLVAVMDSTHTQSRAQAGPQIRAGLLPETQWLQCQKAKSQRPEVLYRIAELTY